MALTSSPPTLRQAAAAPLWMLEKSDVLANLLLAPAAHQRHGTARPDRAARRHVVDASSAKPLIDRAFLQRGRQPVILDIESSGGSPVQSDLIASLIRRRAEQHKVRVVAAIREVGASGGYWLACAADEIHANPMSIVGSINGSAAGGGFGFPWPAGAHRCGAAALYLLARR